MILRTCAHVALLSAAVDKGFYLDIVIDIKKTGSLGSMKLMSRCRNKMDGYLSQVNWIVSHCLHTIRMKNRIVFIAQLPDGFYREQIADLVVCMHQGDKTSFCLRCE